MIDIGFTEMVLIAVVTILVVGPKDLPKVMRTVGMWGRKARRLASEFQTSMNDLAREADLEEIAKGAKKFKDFSPERMVKEAIDPTGSLDDDVLKETEREISDALDVADKPEPATSKPAASEVADAPEPKDD